MISSPPASSQLCPIKEKKGSLSKGMSARQFMRCPTGGGGATENIIQAEHSFALMERRKTSKIRTVFADNALIATTFHLRTHHSNGNLPGKDAELPNSTRTVP